MDDSSSNEQLLPYLIKGASYAVAGSLALCALGTFAIRRKLKPKNSWRNNKTLEGGIFYSITMQHQNALFVATLHLEINLYVVLKIFSCPMPFRAFGTSFLLYKHVCVHL